MTRFDVGTVTSNSPKSDCVTPDSPESDCLHGHVNNQACFFLPCAFEVLDLLFVVVMPEFSGLIQFVSFEEAILFGELNNVDIYRLFERVLDIRTLYLCRKPCYKHGMIIIRL